MNSSTETDGSSILPTQLFERINTGRLIPEVALAKAVLEDALLALSRRPKPYQLDRRADKEEAREWVLETDTEDLAFSYLWCCAVLGLDAQAVKAQLQQYGYL